MADGSTPELLQQDPQISPTQHDITDGIKNDVTSVTSPARLVSQESTASCSSDLQADIEEQGHTELHCACMDFDKVRVGKLLKTGASVGRCNRSERTCLHEMVLSYLSMNLMEQAGHYKKLMDITMELVTAGLDVNMGDLKFQTPLHYVVRHNDQSDVIRALSSSGVRVNSKDRQGQTCLHLAVAHGNLSNVLALLKGGADPNLSDTTGTTPVHLAARGRHHTEVLREVLRCGAQVDVRDRVMKTPLHSAAKAGRTDAILCLLENGADIMARDNSGLTPLHLAAGNDMTGRTCRTLLDWGQHHSPLVNLNATDDIYKETPLHRAVRMRMLHNIRLLVSAGAKVKVQDVSGDSVLHKAATLHEIGAWKDLMRGGLKYAHLQNQMGMTAFQLAAKANNHIAMSMMRQCGINDY